jgi:hypothetical protein
VLFFFIFISSTYIIKFSIYLRSKFILSFRPTFCVTNPDNCLIRMTSPPKLIRISEGLLYSDKLKMHLQRPEQALDIIHDMD